MTHIELTLPDSVHQSVRQLAKQQGVPPDQLMVRMLTEIVAAEHEFQALRARAKKGSLKHFRAFLAKVPGGPPMPGDELPPGFKMPTKKGRRTGHNSADSQRSSSNNIKTSRSP